jgi:DNA-binding NtrC family response regulator
VHILLVDDDNEIRQIICEFLENRNHTVTAVPDGLKALLYLDDHIDVIITDIQMPGISGIDLLRTTRERFPDLPVILITAHSSFETAIAALRDKAYDYLQKPLKLRELLDIINRLKKK